MIKKLTEKQFQERLKGLMFARKIFMPHITNNITIAWEMYQEMVAGEKMEIFIANAQVEHLDKNPLKGLKRPKCPECNGDMVLRLGAVDMDGKQWPTAWACKPCIIEVYSDKSVDEWRRELVDESSFVDE